MATAGRGSQLQTLSKKHRPILVRYLELQVGFLMGLNEYLTSEDLACLQCLRNQDRPAAVMKLLAILTKCKQPGVYNSFLQSLRSNKMDHIADMIENGKGPDAKLKLCGDILQTFRPDLTKITPTDILPYLKCLTTEDIEEITNIQDHTTKDQAALKLLIKLDLQGERCIDELIHALRETRNRRLASAIAEFAGKQSKVKNPKTSASDEQESTDFWNGRLKASESRLRLKCTANEVVETIRDDSKFDDVVLAPSKQSTKAVRQKTKALKLPEDTNVRSKTPVSGKAAKTKPSQKDKTDDEPAKPKPSAKSSAKSSATSVNSIRGHIVKVDVRSAGNCCKNCFKIVEDKEKLICPKCKTKAKTVPELVVRRQVAEVTLKTAGRKTIMKVCHYPELQKFCKENEDAISHYRKVDDLAKYLQDQKSLELLLDSFGDVTAISKM